MIGENERLSALLAHAGVAVVGECYPCVFVLGELDAMVYLEEDIAYTARLVPRSNIWLLYSNTVPERLVGVRIDGFDDAPIFKVKPMRRDTKRFSRLAPEPRAVVPTDFKKPTGVSTTAMMRHLQRNKRRSE